jgi:endo-1,4-beta-xylanase
VPGSGGGGGGEEPGEGGGGGGSASTLHAGFKAKGKLYFGAEIDHYHLNNNPLTTIVKREFGQVTNENSMKWDAIERELPSAPSPRSCSDDSSHLTIA